MNLLLGSNFVIGEKISASSRKFDFRCEKGGFYFRFPLLRTFGCWITFAYQRPKVSKKTC